MSFYSPLVWTVASLAIFALAANLDWLLRSSAPGSGSDGWSQARRTLSNPGFRTGLLTAYMAGIPMLALLLRVPTPKEFGLPGPPELPRSEYSAWQWPEAPNSYRLDNLWIVAICVSICLLLFVANRLWLDASLGRLHGLRYRKVSRESLVALLFFAILFEAHWALFRAGTLSVGLENRTLSLLLALGFLALEAWSSPANRHRFDPLVPADRASTLGLFALLSTSVFYFTGNSVLSFLAHLAVGLFITLFVDDLQSSGEQSAAEIAGPDRERRGRKRATPAHESDAIEPTIV